MFLNGTIEDKRFITQTVLSNSSYYNKKLDVELHSAFDTLFKLSKEHKQQKLTIEPPKPLDFTNKKDPKTGQFVNGGNDEACLEIFALNEPTDFLFRNFVSFKEKSFALCKNFAELGQV